MEEKNKLSARERIGKRVEELRKMHGLSQYKLARLAKLNDGYISRLERGLVDVGIENLERIGSVLGYRIDFISEKEQ